VAGAILASVGAQGTAELNLSRGWWIVVGSDAPPTLLAASELQRCLSEIASGADPAREPPGDAITIDLSHGDAGDGFRWRLGPDSIELRGDGPCGSLYAAYSLLEALGCRWAWPGEAGERLPRGARFELPAVVREKPALPGRCLVIGHSAFLADVEDWIVWAARNRLNGIFVHVGLVREPFGAAPELLWQEKKNVACALAKERSMTIEHGGHLLTKLSEHVLSLSEDSAAASEARRKFEKHFRTHPAEVFHLWGEDKPPAIQPPSARGIAGHSPSERALVIANTAAAVLADVDNSAQLSFLAYHETEEVPARVKPRSNVCLLWAPRERCYAHPADEVGCAINRRYRDTFLSQLAHFRSDGAAPTRVFEYYLDSILFRPSPPPLGSIIRRDLSFYGDAGAHTVQALMTGFGPWHEPHPNAWLFARLAWDPSLEPVALLLEFCEVAFGPEAHVRADRYHALEREYAARCGSI
jgi:hypothetical protein